MYAKVKDRKTGLERTVAAKAYQLIPHRYDLLGYIDEEGNPVEVAAPAVKKSPVRRDVAPAAAKAKLTREDLDRMNAEAMERARKNKEALDSLQVKVPEGYGLNPDQEDTNADIPPREKRFPSATKVKSVKTNKK